MDYQATLEEIDEVTKRLFVSIPSEDLQAAFRTEIGKIAQSVVIKGFRKGKAPQQLVEKIHGSRVQQEVAERLIQKSLGELVEKHALEMVGRPRVEISTFEPGQKIEYKADISLFPSPAISGYDAFAVEIEERQVSDQSVEEALTRLRESQAQHVEISDRTDVQDGDVVKGEVSVVLEGEDTPQKEPIHARVGAGELFEELDAALIGATKGDTVSVARTFPEESENESLRGKKVMYDIRVDQLFSRVLPEVDDAFAKQAGLGVETALELKLKIRERLEEGLNSQKKEDVQVKVLEVLLEKNNFKIPQDMIDDEMRTLLVRQGLIDQKKTDPSTIDVAPFRDVLGQAAEKRVRSAVIIDRIAEQESLELSADDFAAAVQANATQAGVSSEEYLNFLRARGMEGSLRLERLRTKVLEFLDSRAKVTETKGESREEKPKTTKAASSKPAKKKSSATPKEGGKKKPASNARSESKKKK